MDRDPEQVEIEALAEKIRQNETRKGAELENAEESSLDFSQVGYELMGGILGGLLMGLGLDWFFPVLSPWALIIMIFVGFVVGLMNVWRALSGPGSGK